jgi:hypothetical protein
MATTTTSLDDRIAASSITVRVIAARGADAGDLRALYARALREGADGQLLVDVAEDRQHERVLDQVDGCERTWEILEDGTSIAEVRATSGEEALDGIDPETGDYPTADGPVHGEYYAVCRVTGETATIAWSLDQDEPPCTAAADHRWVGERTHSHGGGVVITDHCALCGCGRSVDTWATRPGDGSPVTGTRYDVDAVDVTYRIDGRTTPDREGAARMANEEVDDRGVAAVIEHLRDETSGGRYSGAMRTLVRDAARARALQGADWAWDAAPTADDERAMGANLVADGVVLAACLVASGDVDIDSDGCGLSSEGRVLGLRHEDIDWPSAMDGRWEYDAMMERDAD